MTFDKYTTEASFYPAVATLPPFILLNYYFLQTFLSGLLTLMLGLVIEGVSVGVVFIFLLMEVNRFLSKMILENRLFQNELTMTTTEFLLYKDHTYSEAHKTKIRKKISQEFKVKLPLKSEEVANESSARQRIAEAVSLVRARMKGGRLLLQHNIQYGVARNLIGGSLLAALISLVDFHIFLNVFPNQTAAVIALIFIFLYGALILFSKQILYAQGKQYAKILFQEYLTS
jgi:hypothetical protein